MTALSVPPAPRPRRAGLWTFVRLLGGWVTVAAVAYLMWNWQGLGLGWPTLLFAWVLLTLLGDEFGGWFGYVASALGVLPLLPVQGVMEQWAIIFPLVGGALSALLLLKHSGGPFVLPFGALVYAGTLIAAAKIGIKLDPSMKLPGSSTFQHMAILPMLIVVAFSFVRQLISMLLRWQARRRERAGLRPAVPIAPAPAAVPASAPVKRPEPVTPLPTAPDVTSPLGRPVTGTVVATAIPAAIATPVDTAAPTTPAPALDFDLDLDPAAAPARDPEPPPR